MNYRNIGIVTSMIRISFVNCSATRAIFQRLQPNVLWGNDILMITKPHKNMKKFNISQSDRIVFLKRAVMECVNEELKKSSSCNIPGRDR